MLYQLSYASKTACPNALALVQTYFFLPAGTNIEVNTTELGVQPVVLTGNTVRMTKATRNSPLPRALGLWGFCRAHPLIGGHCDAVDLL